MRSASSVATGSGGAIAIGSAAALFALEMLSALHPDYGYFIDELYYLACARRPDLGYVDHPPLAPLLLAASSALLGESIPAIRALPALAGAATVWLAVWMVARLGGGAFARITAALAVIAAPGLSLIFGVFSMNAFEILLWTGIFCVLLVIAEGDDPRPWPWVGLLLGLAVLNKHTSLPLAAAIAFGVIASPVRRHLAEPRLWLGVLVSLVVALPNLAWQLAHDFVSLDFYANVDREANVATSALAVLGGQIETFNPATLPIWAAGLYGLLVAPAGRSRRALGWTAAALFAALLLAGKSRPDRIMGVYPLLFAAGAVQIEATLRGPVGRRLRWAIPALAVLVLVVTVPAAYPLLPPALAGRYMVAIDAEPDLQREVGDSRLMITLAHRLGSEELAARVAEVVGTLSPAERRQAVVLAAGYSEASALEVLGGAGGLPVHSPHNTYWLWGPPLHDAPVVVVVGYEPEQLAHAFDTFEVRARTECVYCMGWRRDVPIAIARGPGDTLRRLWPDVARFGYTPRKLFLLQRAGILPVD